ncbi:MAG: TonB-dependent receptor [Bacteroidetes bacterium]|nr:MAG: TonB-dependent receptor [Bacteroidota bacterium]
MKAKILLLSFFLGVNFVFAQSATLTGKIQNPDNQAFEKATVALLNTKFFTYSDENGNFLLKNVPFGNYTFVAFAFGKKTFEKKILIDQNNIKINAFLEDLSKELDAVTIQAEREKTFGLTQLKAVENFGIYEGKKTEVIVLQDVTANLSTNNARQIYAKITGLNIWESDGAGLQLGIGGRGLSPNRTANFNTRQNGYDISADALGYPESYYTPPTEALERIEIVRGAASLQYGTQFGGMLNFAFKKGATDRKIEAISRQTAGSWGFFGSFNSIGGTVGKLQYYAYYQHKSGDGFRQNSDFKYNNGYVSLNYQVSEKFLLNLEVTKMSYLAHQAGGLTDKNFQDNPRQSVRARNWFNVDWNLFALTATYKFSDKTQINIRNFALFAKRQSLGNLERINVADFGKNRTLIDGQFENFGSEIRLLQRYSAKDHTFLAGVRLYQGNSTARQGEGSAGADPDFNHLNNNDLENSDYVFPNKNYSFFVENIFNLTPKFSLTPGIRFENIQTFSQGYYKQKITDGAGNIVVDNKISEDQNRKRSFVILGLGASYKFENVEFYGNFSQNYRAINFTDLRVVNPNFVVDPNIQDETGYTADLGIRGRIKDIFSFEATAFYVAYNGRIGQILKTDQPPLYLDYRFRGNIADARNIGLETFAEVNILNLLKVKSQAQISVFSNLAVIDARYIDTKDASIANKKVEMVPPVMFKTGLTCKYKNFASTLQFAHTSQHFSDASNAIRTSTAVEGLIPSYQIMDLSANYTWKFLRIEASCNNLLNQMYFTRRAESYPGPGIIPSDGRAFYLTLQVKF